VTASFARLIPFAAFWFVAVITPGPNTLLFTWVALSQSRSTTLALIGGILGCGVLWAFGGLFGLVWAMGRFPNFFQAAQVVGGLYIGWRGFVLLRQSRSARTPDATVRPRIAQLLPKRAFRMGFLTNLSNPKSLAFVSSLFATTDVARGPLWLGLTGIALMLSMSAGYYALLYALFARPGFLIAYRNSQRLIEGLAGFFFVIFGTELILSGGRWI
jgi:threonine/homoserine/homoserine lactone efflux protein